ncbi:MAG: hypothetical protein MUC63_11020, partial [Planctomycetes bacterium]|nr:hypothetical protein [Planctomycetota bacterium]
MDAQANPGPAAPGAEAAPSPPAGASAGARGSPRETFLAGGVFLAAFGLRLAVWSAWKNDPLAANPLLDAADYHGWASGAAPAAAEPLLWNPLYPYFLKGVYAFLGGPRPSVALLAQAGLGALGAELAYLTARRWFRGIAPALACAALAALYAPFLVYEGLLLGAAAAAFLVWLFLFFSASADRVRIPLVWALPGAALGAAGLAEPTLLAAGVPLAAWLALRPGEARFRRLLRPAALWIGMAASLAPAFVHNARAG